MAKRNKALDERIVPIVQKKQFDVFGFTVDDYDFGNIKSYCAVVRLTNFDSWGKIPSNVYFLRIDCFGCTKQNICFEEAEGAKEAFETENIDLPIQLISDVLSRTPHSIPRPKSIIVSTAKETLCELRKKLIADAYEDLTHEKAIARLKKQLQEINEEGADK